jgi:hypothetical protein
MAGFFSEIMTHQTLLNSIDSAGLRGDKLRKSVAAWPRVMLDSIDLFPKCDGYILYFF